MEKREVITAEIKEVNGYKIEYSEFWQRWQVGHPEIAPVIEEFHTEAEAIEYAEKG